MRRTVWLVFAVVIGTAACGHEPPDDGRALSIGGGDGEFVAGDGRAIGEGFSADEEDPVAKAARLRQEKTEREARKETLRQTLPSDPPDALWQKARDEEQKQNWKIAEDHYRALALRAPLDARAPASTEKAMQLAFRRGEYGDGLRFYEDVFLDVDAPILRAQYARLLAATFLSIPHHGTTRGGEFLRNRFDQGTPTQTYAEDRLRAIALLEEARALLASTTTAPAAEKVSVNLELTSALATFTPLDPRWTMWWSPWSSGGVDDGTEADEGSDEDADGLGHMGRGRGGFGRGGFGRGGGWGSAFHRARPTGIPVDARGEPVFSTKPARYDDASDDIGRIKFLLDEVATFDVSATKEDAARARLLQAMLFRTRDGVERLDRLASWWWDGRMPYQADVEKYKRTTALTDDQAITLVGTHIGIVTLPADESVPRILASIVSIYPQSKAADDAAFLLGQFHQSRLQYRTAIADFDAYLRGAADRPYRGEAASSKDAIVAPLLAVLEHGPMPAGRPARLTLRHRNVRRVEFRATRLDLEKSLRQFEAAWAEGKGRSNSFDDEGPSALLWRAFSDPAGTLQRFGTTDTRTFVRSLQPAPELQTADEVITTDLTEPGLWIVEIRNADADQAVLARTVLGLERYAVVTKTAKEGSVAWVVDALTGAPVDAAEVHVFTHWSDWRRDQETRHSQKEIKKTDARGVTIFAPKNHTNLIWAKKNNVLSFPVNFWSNRFFDSGTPGESSERIAVVVTDRTVYRPGDTVQLKVWARRKENGQYRPAVDVKAFQVRVADSRGAEVMVHQAEASAWGSTSFSLPLKRGAPLGAYHVSVVVDGVMADTANTEFRVEEYKAPEFEVSIESAAAARLGETVKVIIRASYLAGGGVGGGKAHYKIYREDHTVQYAAPGPWDWIYGKGYGRSWYPYTWFPWWDRCVPGPIAWYPWWGPPPQPPRELVTEGDGVLDADGALTVELSTAGAKAAHADKDHRYTVVAEVVDPSRRLVKSEGEVIVTRTSYLAVLEAETSWSDPHKDLTFSLTTITPTGSLVAATGTLVVEAVSGLGDDRTVIDGQPPAPLVATVVETRPVQTDTAGPTRITWRADKTGQFRVSFVGKDDDGREVRSSQLVWAYGPDFQGTLVRTADLEILADKRTYAVGDVARLLVHTNSDRAAVLFATRVDQGAIIDWSVIRTQEKTALITVPITAAHQPNFFVEATTVRDARLVQEAKELLVPPTESELRVQVKVDAPEHQPGDHAELVVTTTDAQGRPVSAEVAVAVFDAATLQIAPDRMPDVRTHLWGRTRVHQPQAQTSLALQLQGTGNLYEPFQQATWRLASFGTQYFQAAIDYRRQDLTGAVDGSFANAQEGLALQDIGGGGGGGLALRRSSTADAAFAVSPAAAPAERKSKESAARDDDDDDDGARARQESTNRSAAGDVVVRQRFADTALWSPHVVTDAAGTARVKFSFPDNTTTWKVKAVGMDDTARAGRGDASVVTTKKLLVRLAAPRFFVEKDEVTLSAIVHNRAERARTVEVSLALKNDDAQGPALLVSRGAPSRRVTVAPGREERVDFVVGVTGEGRATVRATARTTDDGPKDGDAKELSFPVLVHGMEKTVSSTGSIPMGTGVAERSFTIDVPAERRPDETMLTIRTSPSLAGAMIDALPYLLEYPYGCTEQTLSRFVPAVLTRRALQQAGGVRLEDLAGTRTNLDAQQLTADGKVDKDRLARELRDRAKHPIYNSAVLTDVIDVGLTRIEKLQHRDGGWGYWSDDDSSVYTTALTLNALLDARDADLPIDEAMLQRGRTALRQLVDAQLWHWQRDHDWVSDSDAFATLVMARFGDRHDELLKLLYDRRIQLSAYGKLLLARGLHRLGEASKATLLLQNAEQNLQRDSENETAWIETRSQGWWYWWNDDIETNAHYVMALNELRKGDARTPAVVKWLLHHRKHGSYWDGTRDTATVVAALAGHLQLSGERSADYDLEILIDGALKKKVHIDKKNLYVQGGDLTLAGQELTSGAHTVTIRRRGEGAVYFNSTLSYFTLEDPIGAAGLELKVDRRYFKLVRQDRTHTIVGDRGQGVAATEVRYKKVPLSSGEEVSSGDLLIVDLLVTSKNHYTDLAFEDPKPAGAEPVALRSGTVVGEGVSHMELRDDKVVFFLPELSQGTLKLSYRLRAEVPGRFSAMPTRAFAMYAPEIKGNSDEWKVRIKDTP